ncbi:MAG: PqqD family protein [Gemmatimonadaceae bacterium]
MLPSARPEVVFTSLSDGGVLFSAATEEYFGLNPVGARVWELLPPVTTSIDELCERLGRDYPDVPLSAIRADVAELLDELAAHRLVWAQGGLTGDR